MVLSQTPRVDWLDEMIFIWPPNCAYWKTQKLPCGQRDASAEAVGAAVRSVAREAAVVTAAARARRSPVVRFMRGVPFGKGQKTKVVDRSWPRSRGARRRPSAVPG